MERFQMMGALLKASKKVWIARKVRWASTGGRGKTGGKAVDTVPALSLKRTHRHIKDLTAEDLIPMVGNEGDEESSVFYRSLKRSVSTSEPRISEDPNLQLPLRELKPRKDKRRPDENRGIRGVVPHEIVPSSGRATAMQEVERHLEATLQKPYADQRTGPSRRALAEKDSIKQKTMLNRFKDSIAPCGFLAVWKPVKITSRNAVSIMTSTLSEIEFNRKVDLHFNRKPAFIVPGVREATPMDAFSEGIIFLALGGDARLAQSFSRRFPMEYDVQIKLGVETTNFKRNGMVISLKPYDHITEKDFDALLQTCVNASPEEAHKELAKSNLDWRGDLNERSSQELRQKAVPRSKFLYVHPDNSNIDPFRALYKSSNRSLMDCEWGSWTVYSAKLIRFSPPFVRVNIKTSSDWWVPMFHLLAKRLGTNAVITSAVRTSYGPYSGEDAVDLNVLRNLPKMLVAMEKAYKTFVLKYGNPDKYFATPDGTTSLVRGTPDFYKERAMANQKGKLLTREIKAERVARLRKDPSAAKEVMTLTRKKETVKSKQTMV